MTVRYMRNAIAAVLLVWGMAAVAPVSGQSWQASVLPDTSQTITLVGCFQRGGPHNMIVLIHPTMESVSSVTEETCAAPYDEQAVELKDTHSHHLNEAMFGRWIEVTGRLEKLEGKINLEDVRELHVRSFKILPVVIERASAPQVIYEKVEVERQPPHHRTQPPAPEPAPVATTGEAKKLPHAASEVPLIGLIAPLSLAGGLTVHFFSRRRVI